jgi:3-methyladenine DNA glycosylase AlkD
MANDAKSVIKSLKVIADKDRAISTARYFKTGKGEYGEGDVFIGVTVPQGRIVAKEYRELPIEEVLILLRSKVHEHRSVSLYILCDQYSRYPKRQKEIFDIYLQHTEYVNNWDLVDTSARDIVGHYVWNHLSDAKRKLFLSKLAKSKILWERRIAIVSTHYGILRDDLSETFFVSELLLSDTHDLMHKAVGWMLREAGKRDKKALVVFLNRYAGIMPRTTLRYSIEHFGLVERLKYMKMKAGIKRD